MGKKFNAIDYLVDKYVEGDSAIIPIQLKKADDFFNMHDPTQTTLSPDISEYIDKCVYHIPVRFKVKLKIICKNVNEEMQKKMANAVRNHYGLIIFDKNLDLRTNTYKTIWLLLCGIFFLAVVYMMNSDGKILLPFSGGETVLSEILLVAGWFFVWEAVENFVSNRRALRIEKSNNKQMFNADVFFERNFGNNGNNNENNDENIHKDLSSEKEIFEKEVLNIE